MTPGKVHKCLKLQKICVQKFLIFVKFKKCEINIFKSANIFCFVLHCIGEKMLTDRATIEM